VKIPNKVGLVVQQNPLVWALPLQALLLLSNLDLLDPWGDEWSTLTTHVSQPLSRVVFIDPMHPPLYHVLLHYWIRLPWTLSPVATMRAMSAVWALLAAVIIYAFWLRREGPRFQAMFLALWVLSPCLLLHARMARSYSMQLALASLAIYAALHWAEQPPKLEAAPRIRWFKQCTSLYALPVWAGCCSRSVGGLCAQETIHIGCVLYVPWVPILGPALGYWIDNSQSYEGGRAGHEPVGLRGTLGPLCQRRLCLLQQERVLGKAVCRTLQRDGRPIVAVDPFGAFAEPLLNRLGDSVPVIVLDDESSARKVLEAASNGASRARPILLWRQTSDISPGTFVTKLEQELSAGREVRHHEFVAYSLPERWARRLLRGRGQPEYYYRLSEFR